MKLNIRENTITKRDDKEDLILVEIDEGCPVDVPASVIIASSMGSYALEIYVYYQTCKIWRKTIPKDETIVNKITSVRNCTREEVLRTIKHLKSLGLIQED